MCKQCGTGDHDNNNYHDLQVNVIDIEPKIEKMAVSRN